MNNIKIPFTTDSVSLKGAAVATTLVAGATLATEHLVIPQVSSTYGKIRVWLDERKAKKEAEKASKKKAA